MGFNSHVDEHLGFWSLPIFFRVLHWTGINLSTLNQAFIKKYLGKPSSKTFPVGSRSKASFLTSTTAPETQEMLKRIIQSLSQCKNYSLNLLNS